MSKMTLEELREKLTDAFDTSVSRGVAYTGSGIGPEYMKAAAELAKSIVKLDELADSRNDRKNGIPLPGKG